jgi:hypothetical protein
MRDQKRRLTRAFAALSLAIAVPAASTMLASSAGAAVCPTSSVVSGSNFEIDTNANFAVDGGDPCIDWLGWQRNGDAIRGHHTPRQADGQR